MKFHPLYERRFAMGLRDLNADSPGIIATQSTHKQLASFSQASQIHRARPSHQGPAPPRRAPALQRRLHAARLDLAVLSAVRLARRRRADDEGPIGRGSVGRHDPARHRIAQEAAGGPARVRGEGARSGAALVLRSVRARSRLDPRRGAGGGDARRAVGERLDRPAGARSALLGAGAGRRPGTASRRSKRASP